MESRESPYPKHFDGKRFFNPDSGQARGFLDVLRWRRTSHPEKSPEFVDDVTPSKPPSSVAENELRVTMVNHSTVLLQQPGLNILTDPIWSERASPVSFAGPRRRRRPGVRWEDLPPIDIVLLSHNHYDHLDLAALRRIADGGKSQFVVPLDVSRLLKTHNIGPAYELDWGESKVFGEAVIHAVPAFHFSARGLFDRNRTLWCGYMIEAAGRFVYFAGDSGFGEHFSQIRKRFASIDLALLPIGAYEPRWFMAAVHMAPEEAIQAHRILGAKTSIAIHHGTFQLADEALDAPRQRLRACGAGDSFVILDNGQFVTIS